jgi:predicted metalloprotease
MKWRKARGSRNIEDRRRVSKGKTSSLGIFGIIFILAIGAFFDVDVSSLLTNSGVNSVSSGSVELTKEDKTQAAFVSATLGYTEQIWGAVFKDQLGGTYRPVTLVLYKGVTQSPCGNASGATGPFFCPGDRKVYLDTDFFTTLSRRFGAKGDFAAAYVVAHEVAHHVQNELGTLGQANKARQSMNKTDSNRVSVMIELQADCYAGIWARYAEDKLGVIEGGDIREAMNAAKQIGDDTLQRNAGNHPMPHTFTHGTSKQRQKWFKRGYKSGRIDQCDSFAALN